MRERTSRRVGLDEWTREYEENVQENKIKAKMRRINT